MGLKRRGKKGTWVADYYENGARRRVTLGVVNSKKAHEAYGKLLEAIEDRKLGKKTYDETRMGMPDDLIESYRTELERRGRVADYVVQTTARLKLLFEGVERLEEMTAERVCAVLARVTAARSLVPRTANFYRTALHAFFAWLVIEGRWHSNPVKAVKRVRETGATRERRSLAEAEIVNLVVTAPPERSVVYRFAATTGLRRSELAGLRWADLDLVVGSVTVRAVVSKNKKRTKPRALPPGTVEEMKSLRGEATPDALVFPSIPSTHVFYRDLARAGIESGVTLEQKGTSWRAKVNALGAAQGVVDFHCLRVTFCTRLAEEGVTLALAQKLMRHSTPTLTSNVYTRLELEDEHAAVAKVDLPRPVAGSVTGSGKLDAETRAYMRHEAGAEEANDHGHLPLNPQAGRTFAAARRGAGAVDRASFEIRPIAKTRAASGAPCDRSGDQRSALSAQNLACQLLDRASDARAPKPLLVAALALLEPGIVRDLVEKAIAMDEPRPVIGAARALLVDGVGRSDDDGSTVVKLAQ